MARDGDRAAFDRLIEPHLALVRRIAHGRLGPGGEADDCVQAALLKCWLKIDTFVPGHFEAWVAVVARNTAIDRLRVRQREQRRRVRIEGLDVASPADLEAAFALRDAVAQRVAAARKRDVELVVAHHLQGVSVAELARTYDMTTGSMAVALHRARTRLREALDGLWGLGPLVWLQQAFGRARKALVLLGPEPAAGIAGVIGAVATLVIITGGIPDAEAGPSNTSPPPAIVSTQPADASPASSPPDATATPGGTNPAAGPSQPTATSTTTPAPPSTDGPPARDSHPEADVDIPATGVSAGTRSEQTPDHDYGVEIEQVGAPPVGNTSNDPNLRPLDATACTTAATLPGGYCHTSDG